MGGNTLVAHLISRFGMQQAENIATASLVWILERSTDARTAFLKHLRSISGLEDLPLDLKFRGQAHSSEDTGIPDAAGSDASGVDRVIVEAKFWAGLTGDQTSYLQRLPDEGPALLVFVAPQRRQHLLRAEVLGLSRATPLDGLPFAGRAGNRVVAVTSWAAVIDTSLTAVEAAGAADVAGDLRQLAGLCARMDTDAFVPLTEGELAGWVARRFLHFDRLADQLIEVAIKRRSVEGRNRSGQVTKVSSGRAYLGRQVLFGGWPGWLGMWIEPWSELWDTPIWAQLYKPLPDSDEHIRKALAPWLAQDPPMLLQRDSGSFVVPLRVPTGADLDAVLERLAEQVAPISEAFSGYLAGRPDVAASITKSKPDPAGEVEAGPEPEEPQG